MYSRTNPFISRIKERYRLTGDSSSKKTYHISIDIAGSNLPFKVGDSIGILPNNDPREVEKILKKIHATGSEIVYDSRGDARISIAEFLKTKANLARVNSAFLKLLLERGAPKEPLETLLQSENKAQLSEHLQSRSLLEWIGDERLTPDDLAKAAMPLMPRFYSIANSAKVFPGEIHLLVAYVEYICNGHERRGVGSYFLCDLAAVESTPVPIYVQSSNHFTLPQDPNASLIMIGPGTGIAPYRAFLQERIANQAPGRNWLFFGERNRATDFYYESYWTDLQKQARIRLDLAFSRDGNGAEKTYVQNKMYEERKSLWKWVEEGAYFYVCGNAEKMAKDVDAMLQRIVREEGGLSEEDARLYVKKMRVDKRYLADVY